MAPIAGGDAALSLCPALALIGDLLEPRQGAATQELLRKSRAALPAYAPTSLSLRRSERPMDFEEESGLA